MFVVIHIRLWPLKRVREVLNGDKLLEMHGNVKNIHKVDDFHIADRMVVFLPS